METLQDNRYLYLDLTSSLGSDKLLLSQFTGYEALNQLFQFELHLLAENATTVDFDKLIGQKAGFGMAENSVLWMRSKRAYEIALMTVCPS